MDVNWNELGIETVKEVISWVKGAKDLVSEQVPELIQEILAWNFWSNIFTAIIACVVGFCFVVIAHKLKNKVDKIYQKSTEELTPSERGEINALDILRVSSWGVVVLTILFAVKDIYDAMYVWIAPRAFMLDYLKDIIKGFK